MSSNFNKFADSMNILKLNPNDIEMFIDPKASAGIFL